MLYYIKFLALINVARSVLQYQLLLGVLLITAVRSVPLPDTILTHLILLISTILTDPVLVVDILSVYLFISFNFREVL